MIYAYLCEDSEQELFMDDCLPAIADKIVKCKSFKKQEVFCDKIRIPGASDYLVRENFADAAKLGFLDFDLELFITVTDYDKRELKDFDQCHDDLHKKYRHKDKNRSLLAIPARSIEYWLWYLKNKDSEPEKGILENNKDYTPKKAKEELFGVELDGGRKTIMSRGRRAEITKAILKNADYPWLATKSDSFKHFCEHLKKFCSAYS